MGALGPRIPLLPCPLAADIKVSRPSDLDHSSPVLSRETMAVMRLSRLRLRALNVYTNGTCSDVPTCEDVRISAVLESEDGTLVRHEEAVLVYHAILRDSEQLPSIIAQTLRSIMAAVAGRTGPNRPDSTGDPQDF